MGDHNKEREMSAYISVMEGDFYEGLSSLKRMESGMCDITSAVNKSFDNTFFKNEKIVSFIEGFEDAQAAVNALKGKAKEDGGDGWIEFLRI